MEDRKKLGLLRVLLWCGLLFFSGFTLSNLRLYCQVFEPRLRLSTWHPPAMEAISAHSSTSIPPISVEQTIIFPDQVLLFLKYPPSTALFTKNDIDCVYLVHNSSEPHLKLPPLWMDDQYFDHQIVRCPLQKRGMIISIAVKSITTLVPVPIYRWDKLAYEAILDRDNTTVVFVKGLNLRSGRVADPSKFKCIYDLDSRKPKLVLRSNVISAAQEIVRCKTPLSLLNSQQGFSININDTIKVSVRVVGRQTIKSVARLEHRLDPTSLSKRRHEMCICTMLRNQARFLHEWVVYHGHIGVERWFIYDNNSDDNIKDVVKTLLSKNYNITRYMWPWIKTQEAGFSHCALRARDLCEWVGFIDVDEFFHLPSGLSLHDVIEKKSRGGKVGELRVPCHNFGPSGLKKVPVKGVTVGYTCRLSGSERHKSIVRPEKLDSTLINLVHHFHLTAGFRSVNVNGNMLVINHYKYQVWEVFKEKFYRRVAAYVSDWQHERNVGSKDRAPGLGTKAIEPPDWSTRFCEVRDTGLRDWVLSTFTDDKTGRLPWQD